MTQVKIIVEKQADGYIAYPLGLKGIVVGEGAATRKPSLMSNPPSGSTSKRLALKSCQMIHPSWRLSSRRRPFQPNDQVPCRCPKVSSRNNVGQKLFVLQALMS
jgi:hypothetical protein